SASSGTVGARPSSLLMVSRVLRMTMPELAEAVGAEVDEVLAAMEASQAYRAESIDAPVPGGEEASTPAANLGHEDTGPSLVDDRQLVAHLLDRLPDRERRIVELRFFGERSQSDIAAEMGISQMHVSRLLRKALATLRPLA
ncbi:MAG: sigma-70 family RNA polymerase sigma factor, partial [Actinomycetota bacterium]